MESPKSHSFAIVFVLGAPGAGKGTLCAHLSQSYNLVHYSVGDSLRSWMRKNRKAPLAVTIQDKLDNQGFLTSEELNPFISSAIKDALAQKPHKAGILVDGFPRSTEQLESWSVWPFAEDLPITGGANKNAKPDIVLSLRVSKQNAKARYSARARDSNDSDEKFERRFAEYKQETIPVEESYRHRSILIDIDVNETREDNIVKMTRYLSESELWQRVMVERRTDAQFLNL
ncbi:UMP-CMP kinase [Alternaria panax]|uniref:UMP-CMP kinase n=1 Tax=Alternaria panax TaxID=48097 RepID=A0AAD4FGT1_9PLEO|nr:UMP-CMP kinase [Alternaria panax]